MTTTLELLADLGVALGLGLLVGLEREREGSEIGGVRTFPLITVLGVLTAVLAARWGGAVMAAGLIAVAALLLLANVIRLQQAVRLGVGEPGVGITTEVAALVMFGVGAAIVAGYVTSAVVVGAGVALLLHWKRPLHGLVRAIGPADFRAVMRLALIALVILPVLPDRTYGPYGVLNPFEIWSMVVLIVGISTIAYVASKLLGARRGTLLGGVLGGLISSTAATVGYARRAGGDALLAPAAAVMIVIASTVVFARVLIEVALVAPSILPLVGPPIAAVLLWLALLSAGAYLATRSALVAADEAEPPSDLRAAIVFGLLYAAVLFGVAFARQHLGAGGLYFVAGLSGLTDMDAITLSTARLVQAGRLASDTGWRLILVGAMANLVFKGAAVALLGGIALTRRVAVLFGLALAGTAAVLLTWPG